MKAPTMSGRHVTSTTRRTFEPATENEVQSILASAPPTSCPLDPLPTWLLKKLAPYMIPVICNLCNLPLQAGSFPSCMKRALVYPRIKKPNMDQDSLSSYRPISNLPYLSKVLERVIAKRLRNHANESNLFPVRQSAYRAHHSTETAVLSVHNALVRATDSGYVFMLVLLDLSPAFDTVDTQLYASSSPSRCYFNYPPSSVRLFCRLYELVCCTPAQTQCGQNRSHVGGIETQSVQARRSGPHTDYRRRNHPAYFRGTRSGCLAG